MNKTRRLIASAAALAALAPSPAAADSVYHSEHLNLTPVGGAPLRSGFVENIKAEGPRVYAHEIFVLNGARPRTTYSITRDFFVRAPDCDRRDFHFPVTTLRTNTSGNGRTDAVIRPADVVGFEGTHGVMWTIRDAGGTVVYQTSCTEVELD